MLNVWYDEYGHLFMNVLIDYIPALHPNDNRPIESAFGRRTAMSVSAGYRCCRAVTASHTLPAMVFEDNSSPSQYEDGKKFSPDSFQENLFPVCYEDYNLHHLYSIGRLKSD